jgi:protein SCO1/2
MKHLSPIAAFALACLLAAAPGVAVAQYNGVPKSGMMTKDNMPAGITPAELKKVTFDQNLGAQVPLDLPFRDETGRAVQLSQFFNGRPVVLALVYYECPMLCTQALNGLVKSLRVMSLEPGRDYDLLTVSFNPRETPAQAMQKKQQYVPRVQKAATQEAWHFLTGTDASIRPLTDAVGFHYVYDEATNQYAHPAGIIVLTPEGRTSKYIYGLDYGARDLRLALVEASNHKVGTPVDRLLLYCYHYDPERGKYGLVLMNVLRLGGAVTLVCLGAFLTIMWRRERRQAPPPSGSDTQVNN